MVPMPTAMPAAIDLDMIVRVDWDCGEAVDCCNFTGSILTSRGGVEAGDVKLPRPPASILINLPMLDKPSCNNTSFPTLTDSFDAIKFRFHQVLLNTSSSFPGMGIRTTPGAFRNLVAVTSCSSVNPYGEVGQAGFTGQMIVKCFSSGDSRY